MSSTKEKAVKAANRYLQRGQLDKAIREYEKAIDADDRDPRIHHKYAELLARKGRKDEAWEEFRWVAANYEQGGFQPKALAVYKQMLGLDPESAEVNLRLGEIYLQQGKVSDASQHFRTVAAQVDGGGTLQDRIAVYERLVQANPGDMDASLRLVGLYTEAGAADRAAGVLERMADHLRSGGQVDLLLRVLGKLLQVTSRRVEVSREIAEIHLRRREYQQALTHLKTCFETDPQDTETLELLGRAFRGNGKDDKALQVYRELSRLYGLAGQDERRAEIDLMVSQLQGSRVEPEASPAGATELAIPEQPMPTEAEEAIIRGEVLLKYRLVDRAADAGRHAVTTWPELFAAHRLRARALEARDEREEAVTALLDAYTVAMDVGHLPVARRCLVESMRLAPDDVQARGRLDAFDEAMAPALASWTPQQLQIPEAARPAVDEGEVLVAGAPASLDDEEGVPGDPYAGLRDEIDVDLPDLFTREDMSVDQDLEDIPIGGSSVDDDDVEVGSASMEDESPRFDDVGEMLDALEGLGAPAAVEADGPVSVEAGAASDDGEDADGVVGHAMRDEIPDIAIPLTAAAADGEVGDEVVGSMEEEDTRWDVDSPQTPEVDGLDDDLLDLALGVALGDDGSGGDEVDTGGPMAGPVVDLGEDDEETTGDLVVTRGVDDEVLPVATVEEELPTATFEEELPAATIEGDEDSIDGPEDDLAMEPLDANGGQPAVDLALEPLVEGGGDDLAMEPLAEGSTPGDGSLSMTDAASTATGTDLDAVAAAEEEDGGEDELPLETDHHVPAAQEVAAAEEEDGGEDELPLETDDYRPYPTFDIPEQPPEIVSVVEADEVEDEVPAVATPSAGDDPDDVVLDTDAYEPAPFEVIDEHHGGGQGSPGPRIEGEGEAAPGPSDEAIEAAPASIDDAEPDSDGDADDELDFDAMLEDMASAIEQEIAESGSLDEAVEPDVTPGGMPASAVAAPSELDVGLGYLEVGLVDDALSEFRRLASRGDDRGAAQILVGRCLARLERHDEAVDALQRGLEMVEDGSEPFLDGTFELAHVYRAIGAGQAAYQLLMELSRQAPNYRAREVGERLNELARSLGVDEG